MWDPKKRFLETNPGGVKVHADMVDHAVFKEAAEVALLDLVMSLPDAPNPVEAAAYYQQIVGARSYLKRLYGVSKPAQPPPVRQVWDNLDHTQ